MTNNDEFNFDHFDDDDEDLDEVTNFNIADLKDKLPTYQMDKICEIIVCNRYFNLDKDLTVHCMEELAKRRIAGDTFKYEDYIENSYKQLPVLNVAMPDLRSMLNQVIGKKFHL